MSTAFDNSVSEGRTGVITNTTAYSVLLAGTTATGPIQNTGPGTAGQVLTSNGASAAPTFQTGGGIGTTVLLASNTASSSASIEFINLFSADYEQYLFTFSQVLPASNNVLFQCQLGTGAGPSYINANYLWNVNSSLGSSNYNQYSASDTQVTLVNNGGTYGIDNTNGNLVGIMVLSGPNGSSNTAAGSGSLTYVTATSAYAVSLNLGWFQAAAIFTAIKFFMSSGNIASGIIRMYGLKNS